MDVCIRVDDISWTHEPCESSRLKKFDHGLELAQRFHAAMQGRPYLGAVIPLALDQEGHAWLHTAPAGLTVAQHGTTHTKSLDGVPSEYRNMPVAVMRDALAAGRKRIGLPLIDFVPPFNALEPGLDEALYLEGFRTIWGAPSGWSTPPQPYSLGRMRFVPSWRPLYGATRWSMQQDQRPLLKVWQEVRDWPGMAVLTLHITWESAHDPQFDGVRRLIDALGDAVISPQEFGAAA